MRVFLDANILFSAAYSAAGSAGLLLSIGRAAGLKFVTCQQAAVEAELNLERKAPQALASWPQVLAQVQILIDAEADRCPIPIRAKDRPILASAIAGNCDALVTGDRRDFGEWMERPTATGGVRIVALATLLRELDR
jgi:predicted nucleic acid-binding protein